MNAEYGLVVFDLDGTLVDSIPDIAAAFNSVLESEGMRGLPEKDYRPIVGWGLAPALESALPEIVDKALFQDMLERITASYAASPAALSTVYAGIPELLSCLEGRGIPSIVYTNKDRRIAAGVVRELFPEGTFRTVLGRTDEYPPKPDPAALKAYLREEMPERFPILYVGDTQVDAETAGRAGADFAAAAWGYRSREELRAAGCASLYDTPDDLRNRLEQR